MGVVLPKCVVLTLHELMQPQIIELLTYMGLETGVLCAQYCIHQAALKQSSKYIALTKINWKTNFLLLFIALLDELSSYSRQKLGSVVFLRCHSSCLKLCLLIKSKARTSRREFVRLSGYLEVSGNFSVHVVLNFHYNGRGSTKFNVLYMLPQCMQFNLMFN